jgi:hypothetical protein
MQRSCHDIFGIFQLMLGLSSLQVFYGLSLHCFVHGQVNKPERLRVQLSELHLKTPRQCGKKGIIPYHSAHSISFHIIPSYLAEGLIRALNIVHFANLMFGFNAARISRGQDNDHLGSRFKGGFEHFQDSPMHSSV